MVVPYAMIYITILTTLNPTIRLIVIRHGETDENRAGIIQGHLPGKFSSRGIEQAKKAALRLKEEKSDFIYSSDLARAADTAKEIAPFHKAAPVEYVKEPREMNLGEFKGRKRSDFSWDAKGFKAPTLSL